MSHRPAISVIMPVYNTAQYLREAIDSILNQTFTDFEFIIIDDASTDGSKEIIKSYSDDRIVLIENEVNRGYVFGLNYGISIARGEYIARMDSDDLSLNTRLQEQIIFLKENPSIKLCGTFYQVINTEKVITVPTLHNDIVDCMMIQNSFAHPTVIMNRQFLLENQLTYDDNLVPSEDYDLWIKISRLAQVANLPKVLLMYREHINQISKVKNVKQFEIANNLAWENFIFQINLRYEIEYNFDFRNKTRALLNEINWLLDLNKKIGKTDVKIKRIILQYTDKKCAELLLNSVHHNLKSCFLLIFKIYTLRRANMKLRSFFAFTAKSIGVLRSSIISN